MKRGCLGLLLLTIAFPAGAYADTPGTCSNTWSACTTTQICTANPCVVQLQRTTTGSVSMTVNGATTTLFCSNNPVQWQVVDADSMSFVDIRFQSGNSPYGATSSVQADSLTPATPTPTATSGCFVYAITDCPYAPGGGSCGYADPRWVIGQGAQGTHHHHKQKTTSQTPQQ
jgi:hypothetical protein